MLKKVVRWILGAIFIIFWIFIWIGYNGDWIMKIINHH